jgi:prepilin-type processing-associated H-X9-DG protein
MDEDPQGLNDAAFAVGMESAAWFDRPGSYHNRGCGFAFADGHSETHYWMESPRNYGIREPITSARGQQDWAWIRERTSAYASGTTPPPRSP